MIKISYIHSDSRRYNVERSLALIKTDITNGLKAAKKIVVKPACAVPNNQLAATHVEALDAVLNFISPFVQNQIVLAEGAALGDTMNAFLNYGYIGLQGRYDLALVDLNDDETSEIELIDRHGDPFNAKVAKTLLEADYIISVAPPKTHDAIVYAGAIENVIMGSLVRSKSGFMPLRHRDSKQQIYQGNKYTHENIRRLYEALPVRLAVIDGFEAMDGDGPIGGAMVPTHFAISSTDTIAADYLACKCLGLEIDDIGYLSMLEKTLSDVFVIGDDWERFAIKAKTPADFQNIRHWK